VKLEREAKKLPTPEIQASVPVCRDHVYYVHKAISGKSSKNSSLCI